MRFMPSKSPHTALRDILHHIDLAAHFAAGFDYERFRQDVRTVYAVTRCLEIISEASRRLSEAMKSRHPSIAWDDMAGAGNVYRHNYEMLPRGMSGTRPHSIYRRCGPLFSKNFANLARAPDLRLWVSLYGDPER